MAKKEEERIAKLEEVERKKREETEGNDVISTPASSSKEDEAKTASEENEQNDAPPTKENIESETVESTPVSSTITKEEDEDDREDREEIRRQFEKLDKSGSGQITKQQTRDLLAGCGFITTNALIAQVVSNSCGDTDDNINFEQFMKVKKFCWKTFALDVKRACAVKKAFGAVENKGIGKEKGRAQRPRGRKRKASVRLIPSMEFMKSCVEARAKVKQLAALTTLVEECDAESSDEEEEENNESSNDLDEEVSSAFNSILDTKKSLPWKEEEILREIFDVYSQKEDTITIMSARDIFAHVGFHCSNTFITRKVGKGVQRISFEQLCNLKASLKSNRMKNARFSLSFNAVPHMAKRNKMNVSPSSNFIKGSLGRLDSSESLAEVDEEEDEEKEEGEEKEEEKPTPPIEGRGDPHDELAKSCYDAYKDENGTVSTSVIRDCMTSSGVSKEKVSSILKDHGVDKDRCVSLPDFLELSRGTSNSLAEYMKELEEAATRLQENGTIPAKYTKEELDLQMKLFEKYDVDHSGQIDSSELKDMLVEFGWSASNEKLRTIMAELGSTSVAGGSNTNTFGFETFLKLRKYIRSQFIEKPKKAGLINIRHVHSIRHAIGKDEALDVEEPKSFDAQSLGSISEAEHDDNEN